VWAESLTVFGLIYLTFRFIRSGCEIRYEASRCHPGAQSLARFISLMLPRLRLAPQALTISKQKTDGSALRYDVDRILLDCFKVFAQRYLAEAPKWFRQMLRTYMISGQLFERVIFTTMVAAIREKDPDSTHFLYLDRTPANRLIVDYYRKQGYRVMQSLNFQSHLKMIINPIGYVLLTLKCQFTGRRAESNTRAGHPSIWVEYHKSDNSFISLSFWHEEIDKTAYDLVSYFDREDSPLTPESRALCLEKGFRYVDAQKIWHLARIDVRDLTAIFRAALKLKFRQPLFIYFFNLEYTALLRLYTSIHSSFRVKILVQHCESSWKQTAQARALEAVGGIMVGFHWSNYPWVPMADQLYPQQVFFVWGAFHYQFFQKQGNTCRYILPSGLWINKDKSVPPPLAKQPAGFDYLLAVFDSGVGPRTQNPEKALVDFYERLLTLLQRNPSWGAVVKSRGWTVASICALEDRRDLEPLFEDLITRQRLHFLDTTVSPATAAAAADLVVSFAINSAGIIGGIHYLPTVHWDCAGLRHHPLYRDPDQKVVFTSLDELEDAIVAAHGGDRRIGDFSLWRARYNHFDDQQADRRVGRFLTDYLTRAASSQNGHRALDETVKQYLTTNRVGDDFFESAGMWN